ncbi:MAG: STAS domain-containing protein, partial [Acidobacteriota bacterium]|nr:STAS domain-containing protein [Acidobacteriota bacterium]
QVVMNFGGLDYINSTGMRVLLILAKRLAGVKGKLVLCEMKEHILEVFKISGFNQILTITDTEADALERF